MPASNYFIGRRSSRTRCTGSREDPNEFGGGAGTVGCRLAEIDKGWAEAMARVSQFLRVFQGI